MTAFFPLLAAGLASLLLYVLCGRRLALGRRGLREAAAYALETLGLAVAFLAVDLSVSVGLALLARAAGLFVTLYLAVDGTFVFLALLQALVFQRWRQASRG